MHMYTIATGIVAAIEELLDTVAGELPSNSQIARGRLKPQVEIHKRRSQDKDEMRIQEGITVVPMQPRQAGGTNERDDVGYAFLVAIAQRTLTDTLNEDWRVGIWEQAIRQRFNHRRLGIILDSACELSCITEPGELPNWAMLDKGMDLSMLKITCYVRESRRYV
jgi:hypothetical protein